MTKARYAVALGNSCTAEIVHRCLLKLKGCDRTQTYEQITVYVCKDTYRAARIALLSEGEDRELSELIQELLEDWLKSRA